MILFNYHYCFFSPIPNFTDIDRPQMNPSLFWQGPNFHSHRETAPQLLCLTFESMVLCVVELISCLQRYIAQTAVSFMAFLYAEV